MKNWFIKITEGRKLPGTRLDCNPLLLNHGASALLPGHNYCQIINLPVTILTFWQLGPSQATVLSLGNSFLYMRSRSLWCRWPERNLGTSKWAPEWTQAFASLLLKINWQIFNNQHKEQKDSMTNQKWAKALPWHSFFPHNVRFTN